MPHFEDYHRTVIGYHGTRRSVALQAVQGLAPLDWSRNPGDWLGHGVYFWEYGPQQAWQWAEQLRRKHGWQEETAVVASMIRLGNCFDLLDPANVRILREFHGEYQLAQGGSGRRAAANVRAEKRLNCRVFEFAYADSLRQGRPVDTCRAVFVPAGKDQLWHGSGINPRSHIQILVRNPASILGTWLVKPLREAPDGHRGSTEAEAEAGESLPTPEPLP